MIRPGRLVAIMAKAPIAGKAKTRLIPRLGAEHAAMLYHQMLLDTIELVAEALNGSGAISLVCPTITDRTTLQDFVASETQIIADETGSLMGGLAFALAYHVAQGYEQVILLDGDSPTLPVHYLQSAFDTLGSADVVLGPTMDGGHYLIRAASHSQPFSSGSTLIVRRSVPRRRHAPRRAGSMSHCCRAGMTSTHPRISSGLSTTFACTPAALPVLVNSSCDTVICEPPMEAHAPSLFSGAAAQRRRHRTGSPAAGRNGSRTATTCIPACRQP